MSKTSARRMTARDYEKITQMLLAGVPGTEIARRTGWHTNTISKIRQKLVAQGLLLHRGQRLRTGERSDGTVPAVPAPAPPRHGGDGVVLDRPRVGQQPLPGMAVPDKARAARRPRASGYEAYAFAQCPDVCGARVPYLPSQPNLVTPMGVAIGHLLVCPACRKGFSIPLVGMEPEFRSYMSLLRQDQQAMSAL